MAEVSPLPDDVLELGRRLIGDPVFLIGCARSGTSIFGETIAAHPRVAYLFEASKIWNTLVPDRPDHRLTAEDASPDVAAAIYRALGEARNDLEGDVLVEKNPKHVLRIPFLRALFPRGRFLHIVRDGRDVVCSLMFRNRGSEWGHLEVPGWREILAAHPDANHIRCALQWKSAVATARSDAADLPNGAYLDLRYEDLVTDPASAMASVWRFLGMDPPSDAESVLARIQDETRGSYHARRQIRHYVENHARRIGRYRENLDDRQLEDVLGVAGELLAELGYVSSSAHRDETAKSAKDGEKE